MGYPAEGWTVGAEVVFSANTVISSPVSDWPSLVVGSHIRDEVWAALQADGRDLRFSLDEAGDVPLYYDDPRLDVATKAAHLYVGVPSHASGATTTAYVWAGNAAASAPTAAWKQNTYPADWVAHWPMEEVAGATTLADRTVNGLDLSLYGPTAGAGITGNAWTFDGNDYARHADNALFEMTRPFTISLWMYYTRTANCVVLEKDQNDGYSIQVYLGLIYCNFNGYSIGQQIKSTNVWNDGAWHHVVIAADAIYVDGVDDTDLNSGNRAPNYSTGVFDIGGRGNSAGFIGGIDEVTLATGAWSADAIALEYLMLSDPATWASAGDLVSVSTNRVRFAGPNLGNSLFRRANL